MSMFLFARVIVYSALFIGFLLVYLPARLLARAGVTAPPEIGLEQIGGALVVLFGTIVALWCIATFAVIGRGTPAPFDPPRGLVDRGPYRFVRNPMYIGAGMALAGAALFYGSWQLAAYAAAFLVVMHLFVVLYEENALDAAFGADYERYRRQVRRWLPGRRRA